MKKTIGIGIVIFGVILIFAFFVGEARQRARVVYQGKTAREWFAQVFTTNQTVAMRAFKAMGTNALPAIVGAFGRHDMAWDKWYEKNFHRFPAALQKQLAPPLSPQMEWNAAELIFLNNPDSRMVLPDLARLLADPNNPANVYILPCLGARLTRADTNYIPLLIDCLSRTNENGRAQAAAALPRFGISASNAVPALTKLLDDRANLGNGFCPAMEAALAIWEINGETNEPVRVLRELFAAGSPNARHRAAVYLSEIDPTDTSLIPTILEAVTTKDPFVETRAVIALGRYGPAAKSALPDLRRILESPSLQGYERDTILRTIGKIDK